MEKEWGLTPPNHTPRPLIHRPLENPPVRIWQRDGDLLYIPPGWWHDVRTRHGSPALDIPGSPPLSVEFCMHWVSWIWPRAQRERAVGRWMAGQVVEGQSSQDQAGGGSSFKRIRSAVWEALDREL